jgi:hypothetical protein
MQSTLGMLNVYNQMDIEPVTCWIKNLQKKVFLSPYQIRFPRHQPSYHLKTYNKVTMSWTKYSSCIVFYSKDQNQEDHFFYTLKNN